LCPDVGLRVALPDLDAFRARLDRSLHPDAAAVAAEVDRLCLHVCFKVAAEYGLPRTATPFMLEPLCRRLGIVREAEYVVGIVLETLQEEGFPHMPPPDELPRLCAKARERFGDEPFIRLVERCAGGVRAFLVGERRGWDVVFPRGDLELWADLHHRSAVMSAFSKAAALAVDALVPDGGEILEFGAGTGAGTAAFLDRVDGRPIERYLFTDVSDTFLRRARRRFGDRPFVDYARFDLEGDDDLGLDLQVDVAVGVNALHVARSLPAAVDRLRRMVRPGGWIVAAEGSPPAPGRSWRPNVLFGFLEGWWNVETDPAFRSAPGFLLLEAWEALFRHSGLTDVAALPIEQSGRRLGGVVVGRAHGGVR
jgi:SAM-dependent methyltransferase